MSSGFFVMGSINSKVGNRIRKKREAKGWLQKDLAVKANLPDRTVGRIERGEVDVRLSTLEKISKSLRCNMGELI